MRTEMPSPEAIISLIERKCPICGKSIPYVKEEKSFICKPCNYRITYESYCYFRDWIQRNSKSYINLYDRLYASKK